MTAGSVQFPLFTAGFPRSVHLVGVAGAGMCALAELLVEAGCRVTGSDADPGARAQARLQAQGVLLHPSHRAEHLPDDCDCLIYSAAVANENPERQAALARRLPQFSYPQFLGLLSRGGPAICIAGTHGKSTTSAAVAAMLQHAGQPVRLLSGGGAVQPQYGPVPQAALKLILESCEFRRHFLHLLPQTLLLTGIEWDHVDCFSSLGEVVEAFAAFLRRVPESGLILFRSDCAATRRAIAESRIEGRCAGPRVVRFGRDSSADWRFVDRIRRPWGSLITIHSPHDEPLQLDIRLPGLHNALNLAAAAVAAAELGAAWDQIAAAALEFRGVRRRLEPLGEFRGMTLIDDYAHHPTAVRAVLETLREEFPGRPLRVVFQPHQVQRTLAFREAFAEALSTSDIAHVLPAYAARECSLAQAEAASLQLVEGVRRRGGRAASLPSLDHVWVTLETEGRPGDVVVLMGAGTLERIADDCSVRLLRNYAG